MSLINGINVVSLFNGMGCAWLALDKLGIKVNKRYVSEIDKYANIVNDANFPDSIQLGDVRNVNGRDLGHIDLICGGSPCQSFSFAGKRKGMATICETEILTLEHYIQLKSEGYEFEGQSYLFWEFMRVLTEVRETNPNVYFLLENVEMGEKWEGILTRAIGINPIHINSALVSAQNRKRVFWTNIGAEPQGLFGDIHCLIPQPKDLGILLKDILETDVDEKYYLSDKAIDRCLNNDRSRLTDIENKCGSILANQSKQSTDMITIVHNTLPRCVAMRGRGENNTQQLEQRPDQKTNTLTSIQKDNLIIQLNPSTESNNCQPYQQNRIRRLTPLETARLQTVPDSYFYLNGKQIVSDSQIYRQVGNGWTISVISHIFSYLK